MAPHVCVCILYVYAYMHARIRMFSVCIEFIHFPQTALFSTWMIILPEEAARVRMHTHLYNMRVYAPLLTASERYDVK